MNFEVLLKKDVKKFLNDLSEKEEERCKDKIKNLGENPFVSRSQCNIKKLSGKGKEEAYRLRVGEYRFTYAVDKKEKKVYVAKAFRREKEY